MEISEALTILNALSHETRLKAFRALIKRGPEGLSAGAISEQLDVRPNTLSNQLGILTNARLVSARREGRSIIYTADYALMQSFMQFMIADCCNGNPGICQPLINVLADCSACTEEMKTTMEIK